MDKSHPHSVYIKYNVSRLDAPPQPSYLSAARLRCLTHFTLIPGQKPYFTHLDIDVQLRAIAVKVMQCICVLDWFIPLKHSHI